MRLRRTWLLVSHQRMHWKLCIRVDRETGSPTSYEVASEASASVEEETPSLRNGNEGTTFGSNRRTPIHRLDGTERSFGTAIDRQSEGTKAPLPAPAA